MKDNSDNGVNIYVFSPLVLQHLRHLAQRRRSAPSLAFGKALGMPWSPIRCVHHCSSSFCVTESIISRFLPTSEQRAAGEISIFPRVAVEIWASVRRRVFQMDLKHLFCLIVSIMTKQRHTAAPTSISQPGISVLNEDVGL